VAEARLSILEDGHRFRARAFMALASRMAGGEEVDDVFKTVLYRPALFGGGAWPGLIRSSLRGPSEWSVGERELFGAATSQANSCAFCADIHSCTATLTLGEQITPELLERRRGGVFRPRVVATIELIEKVTRDPARVTARDIDAVRATGVTDEAIADALAICFVFNLVNRLADAFGYSWSSGEHRRQGADALVRFGYRVPGIHLR
jgi:AhpD family alkylhydroperoxidase